MASAGSNGLPPPELFFIRFASGATNSVFGTSALNVLDGVAIRSTNKH